jgi:hypothetical protein
LRIQMHLLSPPSAHLFGCIGDCKMKITRYPNIVDPDDE